MIKNIWIMCHGYERLLVLIWNNLYNLYILYYTGRFKLLNPSIFFRQLYNNTTTVSKSMSVSYLPSIVRMDMSKYYKVWSDRSFEKVFELWIFKWIMIIYNLLHRTIVYFYFLAKFYINMANRSIYARCYFFFILVFFFVYSYNRLMRKYKLVYIRFRMNWSLYIYISEGSLVSYLINFLSSYYFSVAY